MSKKSTMVLGYTRTGREVFRPTRRSPASGEFINWTCDDHIDAARILREHGEREQDPKISDWCRRWARTHRALRKSARRVSVRGAAEISIKIRGPR
jgi:hypothetical protein